MPLGTLPRPALPPVRAPKNRGFASDDTRAAYNGANIQTLNAIFGWKGNQMAILYTEAADRRRLAEANMAMMSKTGTSIPSPKGKVRAGKRKAK